MLLLHPLLSCSGCDALSLLACNVSNRVLLAAAFSFVVDSIWYVELYALFLASAGRGVTEVVCPCDRFENRALWLGFVHEEADQLEDR